MRYLSVPMRLAAIFILAGTLAANPALAEKPPWAGGGKKGEEQPRGRYEERRDYDRRGGDADRRERHYFTERHQGAIHEYYAEQFRRGNCPPGLAKKHNGCMPPGLAKQWAIGRPLPAGVVYYDLPPRVLVMLGPPPPGYRFVRVAQDILLMAIGTGMVVDAIDNLNWEFRH